MGLPAANIELQLVCQTCIECGMVFGVPSHWDERRRHDHKVFCCPNGHNQHYAAETETEKYKRKSEMLAGQVRMEREQREKVERQLARVQKGVCPKCNRSFKALERHMKSKHGV